MMNSLICLDYESSRFLFDEIGKKAHPVGKGYKKTTADCRPRYYAPASPEYYFNYSLECRVFTTTKQIMALQQQSSNIKPSSKQQAPYYTKTFHDKVRCVR